MNNDPAPSGPAAADGSLRIRGRNILDLRLDNGETVRQYLASSIWGIVHLAGSSLLDPVHAVMTRHGMVGEEDQDTAKRLIGEAIEVMGSEPFRPVGMKTDTERRLAQLQRRNSGHRR